MTTYYLYVTPPHGTMKECKVTKDKPLLIRGLQPTAIITSDRDDHKAVDNYIQRRYGAINRPVDTTER